MAGGWEDLAGRVAQAVPVWSHQGVDAHFVEATDDEFSTVSDALETLIFNVGKSRDWGESDEEVDSILEIILVFGESIKHLTRTLRVADIGELLVSSLAKYEVHLGWEVMVTQLLERVVVEALAVTIGVTSSFGSLSRMVITSVVSKPHIVTRVGKFESWGHVGLVSDPVVSRRKKTMLQENNWGTRLEVFVLDSPDAERVSVISNDFMLFVVKTSSSNDLLPGHIVLFVTLDFPEVPVGLNWIPPQTLKVETLEVLKVVSIHKDVLVSARAVMTNVMIRVVMVELAS